jgi:hypothetical protein
MLLSDENILKISRLTHTLTRSLQKANGENVIPRWDEDTVEHHQDSIASVRAILADPQMTAEREHERWMRRKLDLGYVCGTVKDDNAVPPTHPLLLPFPALSAIDQLKDSARIDLVREAAAIFAEQEAAQKCRLIGGLRPWASRTRRPSRSASLHHTTPRRGS